jgi:hypothetical protein
MYRVTCLPATLGNQTFKSYWCGGRQWFVGKAAKVADTEMTPELLKALQDDSKDGPGRIFVEHEEDPKPAKGESKKASEQG